MQYIATIVLETSENQMHENVKNTKYQEVLAVKK